MSKTATNCFYFLLFVAYVEFSSCASIMQQQLNHSEQTCQEVHNQLRRKGLISAFSHGNSPKGVAGEICQSSCCSSATEQILLNHSRVAIEQQVNRKIEDLASEMESHALLIQDILLSTMREGLQRMLDMFSEMYPGVRPLVAVPAEVLFSGFAKFFQSQQTELELEQSVATFFEDLLTLLYNSSQTEKDPSLTPLFVACLQQKQRDLKPFNELPTLVTQRLLHMFGVARFYLQALFKSSHILRSIGEAHSWQPCAEPSLRATYCSTCHGRGNLPLCAGVCRQLLSQCTSDLARVLAHSWANYLRQLGLLADSMRQNNNIRDYFHSMIEKLKLVMVNARDAEGHYKLLLNASCGSTEELAALAANITGFGHSAGRVAASHGGRQKRFSGVATLNILPPLPPRISHETSYNTPQKLVESLQAFTAQIDHRQQFFDTLPDQLCTETSSLPVASSNHFRSRVVSAGDSSCWRGIDSRDNRRGIAISWTPRNHDASSVKLIELSNKLKYISELIFSVGTENRGRSYDPDTHETEYDYNYGSYDYTHDYDYDYNHDYDGVSGSGIWPHYGDEEDSSYDYQDYRDYGEDDEDSKGASGDRRGPEDDEDIDGETIGDIETSTLLIDVTTDSSARSQCSYTVLTVLTPLLISLLTQLS